MPEDPREAGRGGQFMDFPTWPVSKELPNDLFTFCRLRYNSEDWGRGRRGYGGGKWTTDYPDADLNFSYRLQQLTSLQVSPKGAIVDINAEMMRHYPFIYMIGFLTDAPFGIPGVINSVKNTDKAFYLVEKDDNRQFLVTFTDEFIETRQLMRYIEAKKFEIGEWEFTKCRYEVK